MADLTEILNALTNHILNERVAGYNEGVDAERKRCVTVALEQRCERGTPWDRACVTIAEVIRNAVG